MHKSNFNLQKSSSISKQQLIDSLTSHISLYNSQIPNPNSNPNPKSSILKWFTSLSIPQRQAHLTIVHSNFIQLLFQMLRKLQSNGHGCFIILPDIPSSDLPSICFRKSHGLLARVAESNQSERCVRGSVQLFSSNEGEGENAVSGALDCVDCLTVSEEFVGNVDGFVSVMDGVSNGRFLRGDESGLSSEWAELGWLKEKGYYSIEAFVANRLEVALRLAWLNHNNSGKKRGVKLKDKVNAVGVGANAFWRKKGCVDWWEKLDDATRRKILRLSLGKTAKSLGHDEGPDSGRTIRSASRKKRKERNKSKHRSLITSGEDGKCQMRNSQKSFVSVNSLDGDLRTDCVTVDSVVQSRSKDSSTDNKGRELEMSIPCQSVGDCGSAGSFVGCRNPCLADHLPTEGVIGNGKVAAAVETTNTDVGSGESSVMPVIEPEITHSNCKELKKLNDRSGFLEKQTKGSDPNIKVTSQEQGSIDVYDTGPMNSLSYVSYEWPSVAPVHLPCGDSHLPPATDRLHLDVSHNWQNHFRHSLLRNVRHVRTSSIETGCPGIMSRPLSMSLDWPPVVRSINRLAPSVTCNYDAGFISRRTSFQQDIAVQSMHGNAMSTEDEKVYSGDFMDFSDRSNSHDVGEDHDYHWMSEEELEVHAVSGVDYNQYFGGGVMYWNTSDHPGANFSRPPSLSSDDSSWAWREADMNRAVDDMVAFSSSYSTNGLTSPSAASFCSPFDPLGSAHQTLGYVIPGSEITSKILQSSSAADLVTVDNASGSLSADGEAKSVDSLPYPILRPIVIPSMSRERSRSDFKRGHDHKSPCVPPSRREQPRIKRPPSPVVLCVPRAPHPPPPSPVGDSRRHRGFPTVRSGSSSPRHWGVKGWFHDGINFEEACIRMDGSEVVWPAWRSKSLSAHQLTQPLPGALLQDRLIAISQLTRDQEHPDVAFPLQPPETLNSTAKKACLSVIHSHLHDEIESFCKQVASENLIRKPYINWAVKRVARSLQVLWPRSRTNIFGSNATGLSLPSSDVDLVVCLPPVRNLEPIKEAGILEGRNGIKETCLQHAARYLANQEWVKNDSLKIVENTAIPIIMLVVEVPHDLISNLQTPKAEPARLTVEEGNTFQADSTCSESSSSPQWSKMNECGKDVKAVRLDISFKSPSHTGLQTTELVKELTEQFPAATPLALVLKQFLADRSLDQSYSGGLSSYCLVLLITRFLQHEHHHGRLIDQNLGSLLMDFFYFFGNVFDPRQMRVSIQGSGLYITRERGCSIDPICIDDPLYPTNNVGRNCFRIHQCIKAFADAYSTLENEIPSLPSDDESNAVPQVKLLPRIITSIGLSEGS